MAFLKNTNNFAGAQQVFPAETSCGEGMVLAAQDKLQLSGSVTMPQLLVQVGKGGELVIGSKNPYYLEPQDPVRDLMQKGFSLQDTIVAPDIRKLLNIELNKSIEASLEASLQASQSFFNGVFKISERYFRDEATDRKFYGELFEKQAVVIYDPQQGFKQADPQRHRLLTLSPGKLLERLREQCSETLHRGYIFDNETLDSKALLKLHQNAVPLVGTGRSQTATSTALQHLNSSDLQRFAKPFLFYSELYNDEAQADELCPLFYIPKQMSEEVRSERGGKVKVQQLAIISADMSKEAMRQQLANMPHSLFTHIG